MDRANRSTENRSVAQRFLESHYLVLIVAKVYLSIKDGRRATVSLAGEYDSRECPHAGHREKMRRRFLDVVLDSFTDHEALEWRLK
jgi:hypothetical protein